jgi:hypothetical protein
MQETVSQHQCTWTPLTTLFFLEDNGLCLKIQELTHFYDSCVSFCKLFSNFTFL